MGAGAGQFLGMLAGPAIGALMQDGQQDRQLKQQEKLMAMQKQGAMELAANQQKLNYDMWLKTGVVGLGEQLEKAGLNKALMYGMSGAGGGTAAGGSGGMPSVATAENPSAGTRIGMDMAMMLTQKQLMDAQTKKTNAEAEQIAGAGTDKITQDTALSKANTIGKELENALAKQTFEDRAKAIEMAADEAIQKVTQLQTQNAIDNKTWQEQADQIKAEAIGAGLQNILTQAQTTNTRAQTGKTQADTEVSKQEFRLKKEQIQAWYDGNKRDWDKMNLEERKVKVQELMKDWITDPNNKAIDQALQMMQSIMHLK